MVPYLFDRICNKHMLGAVLVSVGSVDLCHFHHQFWKTDENLLVLVENRLLSGYKVYIVVWS